MSSPPHTPPAAKKGRFPIRRQMDAMDCGPTCLQMICLHYGKHFALAPLREKCFLTREGVSLLGISSAAEMLGFHTVAARLTYRDLLEEVTYPMIAHWKQRHFVVVYKVTAGKVHVADPAHGRLVYSREEFMASFAPDGEEGIGLLLQPTAAFSDMDEGEAQPSALRFVMRYLGAHRSFLVQLTAGMLLGSVVGLIFPLLTQALVDFGINNQDLGFVYTLLAAQLMLFVSRTSAEFLRGWILLHMGTRINVGIISDFLGKLMKLPLSFFDSKQMGDLLQRIDDHRRIEAFLSGQSLDVLFSMVNLVVFSAVFALYSGTVFWLFALGTAASVLWVFLFLKRRRDLDYRMFDRLADNQSNLVELIRGMPEIKYNDAALKKRWQWEHIQARLFQVKLKGLALEQYQAAGFMGLNELKNIVITFVAAKAVIEGQMTLGMMMAVTYILGQLNHPVVQLIHFVKSAQNASLSLERMGDIHGRDNEEPEGTVKRDSLPAEGDLVLDHLVFQYEGPHSVRVVDDLCARLPRGKVTAIVGASGSGKTTLLKLLLRAYRPVSGTVRLGEVNLENLHADFWRSRVGVVMQDGFLFSDTIAENIALGAERPDYEALERAMRVAAIDQFVHGLPLGLQTRIGADGHGLSQGQKQRLLIARAVYKNPEFLFFDEATSALDAVNERAVMENLDQFLAGRTAVVVAHRLSTVKNADQILVMDHGRLVEQGTHESLTAARGMYYHLVKNQLELGA